MKRFHSPILVPALVSLSCALSGCAFAYDPCDTDTGTGEDTSHADACPSDSVCLDFAVLEGRAVRPGRVAVMWYQVSDADPDPEPQIAWEGRLDPTAHRIVIPIAEIAAPRDQTLLLCERRCADEVRCECQSEPRVGIATIVAADDSNADGRTDAREVAKATFGRADIVIVRSDKDYPETRPPFDGVFASPIRRGTNAYRTVADSAGGTVRLGSPEEGQAFHLNLCGAPGTACVPALPKLRSF